MSTERRSTAIAFAVAWQLLVLATPHATAAHLTRCLTPAAEEELRVLLASGRLKTALAPSLTFSGVQLSANEIVLRAEDTQRREHAITLSLNSERPPDGRGKRFVFHLVPSGTPTDASVTKALLATASLIDGALPDTALADCSSGDGGTTADTTAGHPTDHVTAAEPRPPDHVPRAVALFSAMIQVVILLAATVFGWRAIRRS